MAQHWSIISLHWGRAKGYKRVQRCAQHHAALATNAHEWRAWRSISRDWRDERRENIRSYLGARSLRGPGYEATILGVIRHGR